jgi:hypothetical protein
MWLPCLSLGLETPKRKGFQTFRVRLVGECVARHASQAH